MAKTTIAQHYPKIQQSGLLDDSQLTPHNDRISEKELEKIINDAIEYASEKTSRTILNISADATADEIQKTYEKEGKELFEYFLKYCGDPPSTAMACRGKNYIEVGREWFRNRTLQKERMNAGWRYQYIAQKVASKSPRFHNVSDLGLKEADFNATVDVKQGFGISSLNIYVSVKNRVNTVGGQDWPKAIHALEEVAKRDKNSSKGSAYLCVFGIAIEKGERFIKTIEKTGMPHSPNTEVWKSNFFWPFFTNYSYEEINQAILKVLDQTESIEESKVEIPDELIESFGQSCRDQSLLDDGGCFKDPVRMVSVMCTKKIRVPKKNNRKSQSRNCKGTWF